jgi:hypothetical protein
MEVVGYTYDAAEHCPDCTMKYAREVPYDQYVWEFKYDSRTDSPEFKYTDEDISDSPGIINVKKAIELEIIRDSENNPIHPIFDIDEAGDIPSHCDDCGAYIDTSWNGDTVTYAITALADYIEGAMYKRQFRGNVEALDIWNRQLSWCNVSDDDKVVLHLYDALREFEED